MIRFFSVMLVILSIRLSPFVFEVALDKANALPGEHFTAAILVDEATPQAFDVIAINARWDVQCTNPAIVYQCIEDPIGVIHVTLQPNHPAGTFQMYFHIKTTAKCNAGVIAYDHPAFLTVPCPDAFLPIILM